MVSRLALLLLLCVPAVAQKLHVKIDKRRVNGVPFTRYVPGIGLSNGSATVNGNTANASGSSIYAPPHTVEGSLTNIELLLLLPDGRSAAVFCGTHFSGLYQSRRHDCKYPEVDELEADFSGEKVKLTWGVGLDGKKKVSETYLIQKVYPATEPAKP